MSEATERTYDLVVFDFDGTLCDSADVKTNAFYELYLSEYGADFATAVHAYHLEHAGISRYDKIRYVERELIGTPPSDERVNEVADRFSALVEDAVVAAPLFDGVVEYLQSDAFDIPNTIASATPTGELQRITDRKGMSGFFEAIEGSPRSKDEILSGYASKFGIEPSRIVMVGDQPSDARGAHGAGTDVLVVAERAEWTTPFARVDTFIEAATWLTHRLAPATATLDPTV